MRFLSLIALTAAIAAGAPAEATKPLKVSFDKTGLTVGEIPTLKPGGTIAFDVPAGVCLSYEISDEIGNGKLLPKCDPDKSGKAISITALTPAKKPARALYFNLTGLADISDADKAKLTDLKGQKDYYSHQQQTLTWEEKQTAQDQIAEMNDRISQFQEEVKAFTGMSLEAAVRAIERRQLDIADLRRQIKMLQKKIDGSGLQDQLDSLTAQIAELEARISAPTVLRAGVLLIGEDRKPVYYTLNHTENALEPWQLKRFQKFPVFTTDDIPYVVVLGQRYNQDPQALRATFTSKAGTYIDTAPVRPLVTQPSVASHDLDVKLAKPTVPPTFAYVDRVLEFTGKMAGETIYSVSVSGYGVATTTDTVTVVKGTTPSNQQQTVKSKATLKPLDAEAWPQVHSLYRYNLSTGIVWSTIRTPTFSRVATGSYLPTGCSPTTSVATTGGTTSTTTGTTTTTSGSTSTTTGTTTTTSPSTTTTTTCSPTYQTLQVAGGPRILPALMFTLYPVKRDTQIKTVQWKEVIPSPTFGVSLTSPTDDFFLGASSELKPFRNLQLVYGLHLGRVQKLGANGVQNPLDSTAPQTTTSLHTGAFVGLNFNIDFIKGLFKP